MGKNVPFWADWRSLQTNHSWLVNCSACSYFGVDRTCIWSWGWFHSTLARNTDCKHYFSHFFLFRLQPSVFLNVLLILNKLDFSLLFVQLPCLELSTKLKITLTSSIYCFMVSTAYTWDKHIGRYVSLKQKLVIWIHIEVAEKT